VDRNVTLSTQCSVIIQSIRGGSSSCRVEPLVETEKKVVVALPSRQ
jgi:hypothetical protein